MESRSWYEQQKECERIAREAAPKPIHTIEAGRFVGSRAERRALAAEERRRQKRIKALAE